MTDYLLVYSGGKMAETPEEQASVMQAWGAWFGELGDKLKDGGNPTTGNAKGIDSDGSVMDVPATMMASGYSIISADSMDNAVAMAQKCPVLMGGARIVVYETMKVM